MSAAFVAGAAVSAVLAVILDDILGSASHVVTTAAGASSSTTSPPGQLAPASTLALAASTSLPGTTASTVGSQQAANAITGIVTDSNGHPVAHAYVIGVDSLTVVRTDPAGRFSMPCQITANAITANRTEPLVAAAWLLPVQPTGRGSYGYGSDTTSYPPPPTVPGLGYVFSGGVADVAHAKVVTCDGQPINFALPPGGGVDVQFLDQAGRPATSFSGPPVDNLYLPGLGQHAAIETAPLTADGHQIIDQLGPGSLNLDILYPMVCTETAGPQPGPLNPSNVTIVAGRVADISCKETTANTTSATGTATTVVQP